jgi:O-antigen ligase
LTLYYLFLLLIPFQTHPKLGAILVSIAGFPVTPIKVEGLLTLAAAFLLPRPRDAARQLPTSISLLYAAFACFPLFGTVVLQRPFPLQFTSEIASFTILLIATRRLVCTPDRFVKAMRALMFAEAFGTLWLYKQYYLLHYLHPNGPVEDPNYEALAIVMAIPVSVWIMRHDKSRWWRRIALVSTFLLAFGVFVTQSRGGLLALTILAVAGWLQSSRKLRALVLAGSAVALMALASPQTTWDKLRHIRLSGDGPMNGDEVSTRSRIEVWRGGLRMVESHPIFGVGPDQFKQVLPQYNPGILHVAHRSFIAHNTYVQVAAEGGVPALALFLTILVVALRNCRAAEQQAAAIREWQLDQAGTAIRLGLIAFGVAAFFLTATFSKELWLFVFLSQSIREIATLEPGMRDQTKPESTKPRRVGVVERSSQIREAASG